MSHSYKQNQVIPYYMCDRNQQLTLSMLVNLLMEVSENHSAGLGREESFLRERGISWIILRYEFSISRMPKYNEEIEVETCATEYNKLFTYREFVVRGNNKEQLIKAKATFALMKNDTRKMTKINSEIVEPYGATFSKRIQRNVKPNEINLTCASEQHYFVRYFDIDTNQHVNNSKYIEWLLDVLPPAFLSTHGLKHGIITFDKEVKEGDEVTSIVNKPAGGQLYTNHRICVGETGHASATFKWTEQSRMELDDGNDQ
ncbi:medium-chain acyl-[acyl-carrier-protein] hydrolase [Alkalibacterium subtropicum]|uniref:Medium-chain acyl-[acyl-carrier-protein] hydrolase n=1 Tax=Alkalibacterium subtropicum TaxID=753702 RepID=A0A1I1K286_9LACT|nr:acyl-ACP thioesterase domain-containing protein [Alkalibacterium subtropicum]SFC54621.1 medium-chain acyl-[acyl-carrier-protein] hydrolase [Alkalibacterium subtropicum]